MLKFENKRNTINGADCVSARLGFSQEEIHSVVILSLNIF